MNWLSHWQFWLGSSKLEPMSQNFYSDRFDLESVFKQAEVQPLKAIFIILWEPDSNILTVNQMETLLWRTFSQHQLVKSIKVREIKETLHNNCQLGFRQAVKTAISRFLQADPTNSQDSNGTTLKSWTTGQGWRCPRDNPWFAIIAWLFNWLSAKWLDFR